jgi:hypothetical protein
VLFEGTGNVLQESANLFWDNTNSRLGIGTATPSSTLHVVGEIRVNAGQAVILDSTNGIYASGAGNQFRIFSGGTARVNVATNGNVLIGTTTDAGFKLDVNGTARIGDSTNGWQFSTNSITIVGNGFLGVDVAGNRHFSITDKFGFSTFYFRVAPTTGNILIGTSTDVASSKLTVESTTRGFLPPRMTTTQKNAIATPASGLVVYDTTLGKLCVRTASAWETITSL